MAKLSIPKEPVYDIDGDRICPICSVPFQDDQTALLCADCADEEGLGDDLGLLNFTTFAGCCEAARDGAPQGNHYPWCRAKVTA